MVPSNKYYKSHSVGVTSEVGQLFTEIFQSSLSLLSASSACFRSTTSFILPRYWKSRGTSHYTTNIINELAKVTNTDMKDITPVKMFNDENNLMQIKSSTRLQTKSYALK